MGANQEVREIPRFPGHGVNREGAVWTRFNNSHFLGLSWTPMKPRPHVDGYLTVKIQGKPRTVHRLVLEAFVGPCPPGMQCRHLDGNPANNRLENLAWGTHAENAADKIRHGRGGPLSSQTKARMVAARRRNKPFHPVVVSKVMAALEEWRKQNPQLELS